MDSEALLPVTDVLLPSEVGTMFVMPHSQDSYFHARRANHGSDSLLSWAVTHTHTTMAIEKEASREKRTKP